MGINEIISQSTTKGTENYIGSEPATKKEKQGVEAGFEKKLEDAYEIKHAEKKDNTSGVYSDKPLEDDEQDVENEDEAKAEVDEHGNEISKQTAAAKATAIKMTVEDAIVLEAEEGMSLEKYTATQLERAIESIKVLREQEQMSIERQIDNLSQQMEAIEDMSEQAAREVIKKALEAANLPDTPANISKIMRTMDMASVVPAMSSATKAYIVENNIDLTVENVYKATYSSGNTQVGNISDETFEELKGSVLKTIEKAGLEGNEETINNARWLLDNDLPVNERNLKKIDDVNAIQVGYSPEKMVKAILNDMRHGVEPVKTSLLQLRAKEAFKSMATLQAREYEGFEEVLKGLSDIRMQLLEDMYSEELNEIKITSDVPVANSTASGMDILKDVVNTVHQFERQSNIYWEEQLAYSDLLKAESVDKGYKLADAKGAMDHYEEMMTVPRKDLGDSIKKAFVSIPSILEEQHIEVNDENIKCAKMLSYAQIDINQENINNMKVYSQQVNDVFEGLKPAVVVEMIKEGINPLNMKFEELNEMTSRIASEINDSEDTNYSEYLYRLEQSAKISEAERQAYIGIYRLIKAVEKTDGAAVATAMKAGRTLTMANLLSSVRTYRGNGIDTVIDDEFGFLDKYVEKGSGIDEQIIAAAKEVKENANLIQDYEYENLLVDKASRNIEKGGFELSEASIKYILNGDMQELAYAYEKTTDEAVQIHQQNTKESVLKYAKMVLANTKEMEILDKLGMDITADNLSAAIEFFGHKGILGKEYGKKNHDGEELLDDMINAEAVEDTDDTKKDAMTEAYDKYLDNLDKALDEIKDNTFTSSDMKMVMAMRNNVSFARQVSKRSCYSFEICDEEGNVTNVSMTFRKADTVSRVTVTMDTKKYGRVNARFTTFKEEIKGFMLSDSAKSVDKLKENCSSLIETLENETGLRVTMNFARMRGEDKTFTMNVGEDGPAVKGDTSMLCRMAGRIIEFLR